MKNVFALLCLPACVLAHASEWKTSKQIDQLFKREHVRGTFIVHDVSADTYIVHDRKRAETRYIPASTFKIANTLIGLSSGVIGSVDEVLPYGGGKTRRPEWAHDMSLRDAIKISNVPVYQGLARRIGVDRMRDGLRKLNYGNMDPGTVVDQFWLDGPLKISALEQTAFLDKLAQDQLPFPPAAMAAVRDITRQEGTADLHAKTGWGSPPNAQVDIGWWVGWVKKDGKLYTFALNLDISNDAAGEKRVPLGKAALTALGLL
jgi:beta-lactamase class D